MTKLKVHDEVKLTILDHCKGNYPLDRPILFDVYGRVMEVGEDHVALGQWIYPKGLELDGNVEVSIILISAIKKVRIFK